MKTNEIRLIDANYLDKQMGRLSTLYAALGEFETARDYNFVRTVLDTAPTVDAVEVVHGHWISKGYKIECSVCEHRAFLGTHDPVIHTEEKNIRKYCHNCGAKMDGERKDE